MAVDTKPTTKAPTGLSISRNGTSFTCSWTCGASDYDDGQEFEWAYGQNGVWTAWLSAAIGKNARKKTVSVDGVSGYNPYLAKTLNGMKFRVRGRKGNFKKTTGSGKNKKTYTINPKWSSWSSAEYDITIPDAPAVSFSLSSDTDNSGSFSWSATGENGGAMFADCLYQSTLAKEGGGVNWGSITHQGTGGASGSLSVTEDSTVLATCACQRWIRVCSRGAAGNSGWQYASHTYARPYTPAVTAASYANGEINVSWEAQFNDWHPIDSCTVYYAVQTPEEGLACPAGVSWTAMTTIAVTQSANAARYAYAAGIGEDECLWVKVVSKHDNNETESAAFLAGVGMLATPALASTDIDAENSTLSISATNNSSVPDSFLAVMVRLGSKPGIIYTVAILPHGTDTMEDIQLPDLSEESAYTVDIQAFQGSYTLTSGGSGVAIYSIDAKMRSERVEKSGQIAHAPANVATEAADISGTIKVTWDWTWSEAKQAELSWSDHIDAWESTDQPDTFTIDHKTTSWNISGLDAGTYYVRVRLISGSGDDVSYGPWSALSDAATITLGTSSGDAESVPDAPVLTLDAEVLEEGDSLTASWGYSSGENYSQAYAEICEASIDGGEITYSAVIATTTTAQSITLSVDSLGWETGTVHYLCVRAASTAYSGTGDWSNPAGVLIAEPINAKITSGLETITVVDDEGLGLTHDALSLTDLPVTVSVTGAGDGGTVSLSIKRAAAYHMERPDGSENDGYEGESVYTRTRIGDGDFTIENEDLSGFLDDGAKYNLVATVTNSFGQVGTKEVLFEVHWTHQAGTPSGTAVPYASDRFTVITPTAPDNYEEGDVCDIYRLSADAPELIIKDAAYGTAYVDPYPALGDFGGHRIVGKTKNGDYITETGELAWIDLTEEDGNVIDLKRTLIDFGGQQAELKFNLEANSTWSKDFERKTYLGGSVSGSWNPAVTRDVSVGADLLITEDAGMIRTLRELAAYTGSCHVRTPDGSSYTADVQIKESRAYGSPFSAAFDLSISKIDPEELEGMTLERWKELGNTVPEEGE